LSSSKGKGRGSRPAKNDATLPESTSHEASGYPRLSLRHLQRDYGVEELSVPQRAAFLLKWAKRSQITWVDLNAHQRHGLGSEQMPASQIKPTAPQELAQERYMVFRHDGNLPFAGYRVGDTFYVLWIEAKYGDLYDH